MVFQLYNVSTAWNIKIQRRSFISRFWFLWKMWSSKSISCLYLSQFMMGLKLRWLKFKVGIYFKNLENFISWWTLLLLIPCLAPNSWDQWRYIRFYNLKFDNNSALYNFFCLMAMIIRVQAWREVLKSWGAR